MKIKKMVQDREQYLLLLLTKKTFEKNVFFVLQVKPPSPPLRKPRVATRVYG